MQMLRNEKTTVNHDDSKVLLIGAILTLFILVGPMFFPKIQESRMVRDFFGLTPFKSVTLFESHVEGRTITINGSMIKVRCTFKRVDAYIIGDKGIAYGVDVNTDVEDKLAAPHNRVASPLAQAWGPWSLSIENRTGIAPVGFEVHVQHKCPNGSEQDNLFVSGSWGDFNVSISE